MGCGHTITGQNRKNAADTVPRGEDFFALAPPWAGRGLVPGAESLASAGRAGASERETLLMWPHRAQLASQVRFPTHRRSPRQGFWIE